MNRLVFPQDAFEQFQALAAAQPNESCAIGFVSNAGASRWVVRDFASVPENAYLDRTPVHAALTPHFCLDVSNRARKSGHGVIFAHTHPGPSGWCDFSGTDDRGEELLASFFRHRIPLHHHFAMVVTANGAKARELGTSSFAQIETNGPMPVRLLGASEESLQGEMRFDRQVRALGVEGQSTLGRLRVAIVGLGGTGSIVAHELAHLGVRKFLLVDPDAVEETNLNRLLGASAEDRGQAKVLVAARSIRHINPDAAVAELRADVVVDAVALQLVDCDFIFMCTDSHASRAVVNQLAYQYLISCIDMGVAIRVHDGQVSHIAGRVQMLASGLPCLICANWIDADQVRVEMMSPEQRRTDPYFIGASIPQPAVISLNGTVSSYAVTMFLSSAIGFPGDARMAIYDGIRGSVRPTVMNPQPSCIVCSSSGALARGATWSLPTRPDVASR